MVTLVLEEIGFQDCLGQLLDEQRHAIGLLDDLKPQLLRQRFAPGDLVGKGGTISPAESVERVRGNVREATPWWGEFGAEGDHQQHPPIWNGGDETI